MSAESGTHGAEPATARPVLRIVRGLPTPEELAAVTALLSASGSAPAAEAPAPRSRWGDPAARVRRALRPGPGAWASSARR